MTIDVPTVQQDNLHRASGTVEDGRSERAVTARGTAATLAVGVLALLIQASECPRRHPAHARHCRSRPRYWMASAQCSAASVSAPARSAIVRATLSTRS